MVIIVLNGLFTGASPLLMDQLLGAVIPNVLDGVEICLIDLALFSSILVVGQSLFVWSTYKLNVSKMDGAGFSPLFQRQLARHGATIRQSST